MPNIIHFRQMSLPGIDNHCQRLSHLGVLLPADERLDAMNPRCHPNLVIRVSVSFLGGEI